MILVFIPALAIVEDRKRVPDLNRLLSPKPIQKEAGTRKAPVLPLVAVAVTDRIVMNVIDACPKVGVRTHRPLKRTVPDLSPAFALLAVPSIRGRSVHLLGERA